MKLRKREVGREEDLAWVVYARSERRGRERERTWSKKEEKMGALSALSALSSLISPCERTTTLLLLVPIDRLCFFGDLVGSPPHYCTITTSPLLSSLLHPEISCYLLRTTNYRLLLLLLRQQRRRRLGEEGVRACVVFFYFLPFLFLLALFVCMYVCGNTYVDVTRYEEEARTSKGIEESL